MRKCLVYENSLRFSRAIYGTLALIAFLFHNFWLVLLTSILMFLGAVTIKYNLFYQFHFLLLRRFLKDKSEPLEKDSGELAFACSLGGSFLFFGFLLLYFGKLESLAWILVLLTSILMLLAGIAGICTATLIYAFGRKICKR